MPEGFAWDHALMNFGTRGFKVRPVFAAADSISLAPGGTSASSAVFSGRPLSEIPNISTSLAPANWEASEGTIIEAVYTVDRDQELNSYVPQAGEVVEVRVTTSTGHVQFFAVGTAKVIATTSIVGDNIIAIDFDADWPVASPAEFIIAGQTEFIAPNDLSDGQEVLSSLAIALPPTSGDPIAVTNGIYAVDDQSDAITYTVKVGGAAQSGFTGTDLATVETFTGAAGNVITVDVLLNGALLETSNSITIPASGAPVVTFTAPDDTLLTAYTGEDGQTWAEVISSGETEPAINGNRLFPKDNGSNGWAQTGRTARAAGRVDVNVEIVSANSGRAQIGPMLYDAVSGRYYHIRVNEDNNKIQAYQLGGSTDVVYDASHIMTAGTSYDLAIRIAGDVVEFLVDDVVVGTRSKSAGSFGDHIPGIRNNNLSLTANAGAAFNSFSYEEL